MPLLKKNKKSKKDKEAEIETLDVVEEEKPKKKKKKKGALIFFLLLLVVAGGVAAIVMFNPGNIRERYLRGIIEKIPIVNNILPKEEPVDEYADISKDELIAQLEELKNNSLLQSDTITALTSSIQERDAEIERLKNFEEAQEAFRAEKSEFDAMIASNDPAAFTTFYESMNPENAQQLYQEAVLTVQQQRDVKRYVTMFEIMDSGSAADVLSELIATDMDLVVLVLQNIDVEQAGAILAEMTPQNAASVSKRMAPP